MSLMKISEKKVNLLKLIELIVKKKNIKKMKMNKKKIFHFLIQIIQI